MNNKEVRINVYELIGYSAAILLSDGEILHKQIKKVLDKENTILILDFNNISIIASEFLNIAIGQLYGEYEHSILAKRLTIDNLADEDLETLKRVIDNAKNYFKNKEKMIMY